MKTQLIRTHHRRLPWSIAALSVVCALTSAQPFFLCNTAFAEPSSSSSQPSSTDESIQWTLEDFNITEDPELGKCIGGRMNINHPATPGHAAYTENVAMEGFSEKGFAKLKKTRHVVIPEGIQAIKATAFIGRTSGKPDNFIDTLVLPKSLKVIEYGAFGYNTIKGTLVIPKNVVSLHSTAFIGNQIEKVVFEGIIDEKGKLNESDNQPYYLAGIGSRVFQKNKIKEIVVPGNLGDFNFRFDKPDTNNPNPDPGPFDNQQLGTTTIEVGEKFEYPITIQQAGNKQEKITYYGGFKENGRPTLISGSSYFKLKDGAFVAQKPGTIDGQMLVFDIRGGETSPIAMCAFTYEILPKGSLCTVTFKNDDAVLSSVRVRKGQSIAKGAVNGGVMPANPKKEGRTFMGWNTKPDGTGEAFSNATPVTSTITVYAQFDKPADAKKKETDPRVGTLYRLYNPYTHEHFFTAETTENDNLVRLGWKSEGGVGYIYKHAEQGGVYRLYNPTTGEHHYTMKEDEVAACVKDGWKNEGVKWFSAQNKEVTLNKLYSMYNPYEKKFYHHYTADAKEIEQMVKAGWRKEEVKWCTLPVSYIIKK